jgi:hypothetical protein
MVRMGRVLIEPNALNEPNDYIVLNDLNAPNDQNALNEQNEQNDLNAPNDPNDLNLEIHALLSLDGYYFIN